jgi:hypothetical protein
MITPKLAQPPPIPEKIAAPPACSLFEQQAHFSHIFSQSLKYQAIFGALIQARERLRGSLSRLCMNMLSLPQN